MTEDALASGGVSIGAYESTRLGVIVTGQAIIELGFGIVIITAVAQGVDACHGTRCGNDLAVGVVFIGCYSHAVAVDQANHITLEVQNVVVIRTVVLQSERPSVGIVEEVQVIITVEFPHQLAIVVDIHGGFAAHSLCSTQAIFRVVEGNINTIIVGPVQSAKLAPSKVPAGAVVVAGGISGIVIGDFYAVVFGQQVTPFGVAVGIFMVGSAVRGREDVAYIVIGVGVGGILPSLGFYAQAHL